VSLQPFEHPVCTADGTIFDLTNILPWIKKHGTNPVDGKPLKSSELIKLNFVKNDDGEYVDPVTFKVFTDNTHIVALGNTGNVFSWDTIERLNIKGKNWKDLVTDQDFARKDIITIQDPQNVESRDMSQYKHLQEGTSTLTSDQEAERGAGIKGENLGSAAKILKAKEAVAKRREGREKSSSGTATAAEQQALAHARKAASDISKHRTTKPTPYNAAQFTSGAAAASFTSTGLTPNTSNDRAILSDEEYMLKPKRVKHTGYASLRTTHGSINLALYPEFAPKAVWNFLTLAKKGAYNGVPFHRNIRNFMLQGGDPTGTGRGGQSCWGKPFADELEGPLTHDGRGVLSMANKGKDTNTSQFFLTYRATPHLDRKHTIFGRVMEGLDTLARLEAVPVDDKDHPQERCAIEEVIVFVNPFEEFLKERSEDEAKEARKEALRREGGAEDERTTWTGKRIRADGQVDETTEGGGVGKYLRKAAEPAPEAEDEIVGEWEEPAPEPPSKKRKGGGFGNFDAW
jgi:peptidyl-prolyl cis-trans isomerase-like protein 2